MDDVDFDFGDDNGGEEFVQSKVTSSSSKPTSNTSLSLSAKKNPNSVQNLKSLSGFDDKPSSTTTTTKTTTNNNNNNNNGIKTSNNNRPTSIQNNATLKGNGNIASYFTPIARSADGTPSQPHFPPKPTSNNQTITSFLNTSSQSNQNSSQNNNQNNQNNNSSQSSSDSGKISTPTTPSKKASAKKPPITPTKKKPAASKRKTMDDDDEDYKDNSDNSDDDTMDYEDGDDDDYQDSEDEKSSKTSRSSSASRSSVTSTPTKSKPFKSMSKKEKEERYQFLVDVKDMNQIPKGQPGYDPRTIYIPSGVMIKFTPFERQFWEIKSRNYDTVVFFKKGKFYELYENDADIGNEVFGLKMTDRVNMRMVGVPESGFQVWANKFIQAGYKVAKVDQMETKIGQAKREKEKGGSANKKDSIIQRELVSVLTLGTLVDESMLTESSSNYLMVIKEDDYNKAFGVCIVDTSVGQFSLTSFKDDDNRSQLETILLQTMPKELVLEKGVITNPTLSLIKRILARQKYIINQRTSLEYWDEDQTVSKIKEIRGDDAIGSIGGGGALEYLIATDPMMMSALGATLCYLFDIKIGYDMVRQARFQQYDPTGSIGGGSLVMDGQCLINLELFNNTTDGGTDGTLFKVMDRCQTALGKRLLKQWVCRPLANYDRIKERLDAVDVLGNNRELFDSIHTILHKLPDVERIVSRIHARASTITDLSNVMNVLELCQERLEALNTLDIEQCGSKLLKLYLSVSKDVKFGDLSITASSQEQQQQQIMNQYEYPNVKEIIEQIRDTYVYENGKLTPTPGSFPEYDECIALIKSIEKKFEEHLQEQRKFFGAKVEYKTMGKEIYQIEVPVSVLSRVKIDSTYTLKSNSKVVKRFYTPFIEKTIPKLLEAQDTLEALSKELFIRIQEAFSKEYSIWQQAIQCLSHIDCLMALTRVSHQSTITMCRPTFVLDEESIPCLQVTDMRHPAITSKSGDDFIPNDLELGGKSSQQQQQQKPSLMVLTGPNMGGKSTLLRQVCILTIMAQLGCYVPATSCRLSIVDRIFTRLGANDDIMAGQSTFMTELRETSSVLRYATKRSLVIMDELGRGTSTFDGYSIAFSVLKYMVETIGGICIFATHYQSLANEPSVRSKIATAHMSCTVDDDAKKVIFLYKLCPGICPDSYGIHVGAMAGIPTQVITSAESKAKQFEKESTISTYVHGTIHRTEAVRKISTATKSGDYQQLISLWKALDLKK